MNNSDSENEKNAFFINNYNYNEQPPEVDENNIYYIMNKSDSDKINENNNISTKENINLNGKSKNSNEYNKEENLNQNKKKNINQMVNFLMN